MGLDSWILGDAYLNSKQYSLALAAYNGALAIDAKDAAAVYGIGLVYISQKNFALAQTQKLNLMCSILVWRPNYRIRLMP